MPNHKSAEKRVRGDAKKNSRNSDYMSSVRTAVKKLYQAVKDGEPEVKTLLKQAQSLLSKAGQKGIIHKNNASRKVGRLTKFVAKAAASK